MNISCSLAFETEYNSSYIYIYIYTYVFEIYLCVGFQLRSSCESAELPCEVVFFSHRVQLVFIYIKTKGAIVSPPSDVFSKHVMLSFKEKKRNYRTSG